MKKLLGLLFSITLLAGSLSASNVVNQNPYIIDTAMGATFYNTAGHLPTNKQPIDIALLYWSGPVGSGDHLTIQGTNGSTIVDLVAAAGVSQSVPISMTVQDFKVTVIDSGVLYMYAKSGGGGAGGSVGGANTDIQFNDNGLFGGNAALTFNKSTLATVVGTGASLGTSGTGTITATGISSNPLVLPGALKVPTYVDVTETAAPSNPSAGIDRLYTDSTTHDLTCLTSGGGSCIASGGGVSIGAPVISGTAGSMLFVDGSGNLGQDNANLAYTNGGSGGNLLILNSLNPGFAKALTVEATGTVDNTALEGGDVSAIEYATTNNQRVIGLNAGIRKFSNGTGGSIGAIGSVGVFAGTPDQLIAFEASAFLATATIANASGFTEIGPWLDSAALVTNYSGFTFDTTGPDGNWNVDAMATLTNLIGFWFRPSAPTGGGSPVNVYGVKIEDVSIGTNNWAIKTGTGLVQFGDREQLGMIHFASLGTVAPGQTFWCDDCDPSSVSGVANECTSAGTKVGAVVFGSPTKWACLTVN